MRYTNKQYARALVEALIEEKNQIRRKKIIGSFLDILKRDHRSGQLRFIVNETEREYYAMQGLHRLDVYSVAPLPDRVLSEMKAALGGTVAVNEHTDPSVLGGARLLIDGETLIDASARRQLERLFTFRNKENV